MFKITLKSHQAFAQTGSGGISGPNLPGVGVHGAQNKRRKTNKTKYGNISSVDILRELAAPDVQVSDP